MKFDDILYKFRRETFTQKEKGTRFERLMRSWLLSDPRYPMLTEVWLWEDFPSKADFGGKDTGIDLVARTDSGDYWAIQCKCYKEDATIDKPAVDSFLATSSRPFKDVDTLQTTSFARRVWISTTNHWGINAEEAIQNQNPPVNRISLVDLQNSPVDWKLLLDGLKGNYAMRFSTDLEKSLPRIPIVEIVEDFMAFYKTSKALAYLHLNYEQVPTSPDVTVIIADAI